MHFKMVSETYPSSSDFLQPFKNEETILGSLATEKKQRQKQVTRWIWPLSCGLLISGLTISKDDFSTENMYLAHGSISHSITN